MDRSSVSLELRLIRQKIGRRLTIAESLAKSAWDPKKVEVPPGDRFLVIAPHPDDDVISSAGTILNALSLKKSVKIQFLSLPTLGSPSKEARKEEVLRSLDVLGVQEFSLREEEFPATVKEAVDLIAPELERWKPDCVFVPSPLENQNQHLLTFVAYLQAMRRSQCQAATALYEVWGLVIPNMVVDITAQVDRKGQSIAAHGSQVKMVDYVRLARSLNEFRAISSNMKGYAEAFLYLEKEDLLKTFSKV
jgi:LmbE family N-acetylglucosaminyl deacetylase